MRMSRSIFLAAGILTAIVTSMIYGHAQATALIVPDNFPTIQAAIDAASPGDTIIVRPGMYFENLTLNKAVILTAESYDPSDPTRNTTIIDGSLSSTRGTITVPAGTSPMPTIRGFVIQNGTDGITVRSEAVIEYNYFLSAGDQLDYGLNTGGIIRNNVFFASGDDAIDLDNMNRVLTIEHNRIMYSADDGIEIRLQDTSAPAQPITITIRDNEIIGCDEDGIQLIDYSQPLDTNRRFVISGNLIANSRFAGIGLMPDQISKENYSGADIVEAVRVYNNTLYGNNYGISGGDNLVAFNNIITNSITKGVWRVQGPAGANSVIAHTLFYNNALDADQSDLGAGNMFGQDPLFVYPPNAGPDGLWGTADDDFSGLVLLAGSPAIDAGVTQYVSNNGEAIPPAPITNFIGLAPDLGWKEFVPDGPPASTPTWTSTPTETGIPALTHTPTSTLTYTATPSPTFTPTEAFTPTDTATSTATATPTQTPTSTSSPPGIADLIFTDGFESGDLSAWSSSTTDSGDLSASSNAALSGSYGLKAVVDDNNAIYVTDDSPDAEKRYRAHFFFDPNSISMKNNDNHFLFYGYAGTSTLVFRLQLRYSNGNYQLRAALRNDSNSWAATSWFTISDVPHSIEIDWRAATASGTNNGGLTLWIDDVQRADLTGVDNDTRRIDRVRLGAVTGIDTGTRGDYYFDLFESRRQTYIGP